MKKKISIIVLLIINVIISQSLYSQKEVVIKLNEGLSQVPIAIPTFIGNDNSEKGKKICNEIHNVVWNDLRYSRVFQLIPKEHYNYIQKFNENDINFKDWSSIKANILITGKVEISEGDRIVFSIKVYDCNSQKFIFGRNFGGKFDLKRIIAHRASDVIMEYFGEKSYFTTKVVFVSKRDGNKEVYIMDYDGKRQRRITFNDYIEILPSWSRDNEKIVYTSYRKNNPDLYMFHIYTGRTELLASKGANYSADWHPTDNKIVFATTKDGNAEIYTRDMGTGKLKRLTFNRTIDTTPSWSPNGREIAFTSQRSGTPQIYVMDAEGTNIRRITHEGTYHDSPRWSPDGTRLIYVSRIEYRFDLYVYNFTTDSTIKLTENAGRNENPTWSPDGRHILFSSNRNGKYQLYSIDYDGKNLIKLTSKGENETPKWQKK